VNAALFRSVRSGNMLNTGGLNIMKKWIALLFAGILASSVLIGCSKDSGGEDTTGGTTATTSGDGGTTGDTGTTGGEAGTTGGEAGTTGSTGS
jgi:hypothetical protein